MKVYLIILIIVGGIAAKCTYANEPPLINAILSKLNTAGKDWLSLWGYNQLTKDDIKKTETQSIKFNNSLDNLNASELFKIYSDSNHTSYADIYSGTFYMDSSINEIKLISEPESVLKLFYKGSLNELLHYGYTIVFQDVFWINENKFIVVGYEIEENNEDTPIVWLFDLSTKQYSSYTLNVSKNINDTYLIDKLNKKKHN